ncbi:MAG: T9SS type A sorting domain-containing protein [Ignavibacteria bacterium]|nr:T9SS type A sorting domain-containing protein [Ignavibacteria bacterium]
MSLSPNPTNNILHLTFGRELSNPTEVRILNILGQEVAVSNLPAGVKEWNISVEDLPIGTYIVHTNGETRTFLVY